MGRNEPKRSQPNRRFTSSSETCSCWGFAYALTNNVRIQPAKCVRPLRCCICPALINALAKDMKYKVYFVPGNARPSRRKSTSFNQMQDETPSKLNGDRNVTKYNWNETTIIQTQTERLENKTPSFKHLPNCKRTKSTVKVSNSNYNALAAGLRKRAKTNTHRPNGYLNTSAQKTNLSSFNHTPTNKRSKNKQTLFKHATKSKRAQNKTTNQSNTMDLPEKWTLHYHTENARKLTK